MNKEDKRYLEILKAFEELIVQVDDDTDAFHIVEVLSEIRAKHLFSIVADNMMLTYEYAINIVKDNIDKHKDEITDNRALSLISAVENLIDFAVYQEYTMMTKMPSELEFTEDEDSNDTMDEFNKFNLIYANVENSTVKHSALIAYLFANMSDNTLLTYLTQNDEKVRYSPQLLNGLTYPKSDFPSDLIPPIDYNCRCFIVDTGVPIDIHSKKKNKHNETVNPIFSESLAKGGRIFNDKHPYFNIDNKKHIDQLSSIIKKIKDKWLK